MGKLRFGILEPVNPFISFKAIQAKFLALNSNLEVIFAVPHPSIKLADFGMSGQESA